MKEISVVITMDCEPITSLTHAASTGPHSWELGEHAVRGYTEIAEEYGFPLTFFIHPEVTLVQADLFRGLAARGAALGLHIHPWKYSLSTHGGGRYLEHYGGLSEEEQHSILKETADTWAHHLGRHPLYFRPGTFSANDAVFKVLAREGFIGSSCSLPGRIMPEMRAAWAGTVPDPHRGHASLRLLDGRLDIANMPLSTDFSRALDGKLGGKLHPDLRPDIDWMEQYGLTYLDIAGAIVGQVAERDPAVPCINLVSHNHFDYSNGDDPATLRFRAALEAIHSVCEARGIRAKGATIADITDMVLSAPPAQAGLVCEGNLYGSSAGGLGTLDSPPRP